MKTTDLELMYEKYEHLKKIGIESAERTKYWKERCALAERMLEGKSDYCCSEDYFEAQELYDKLVQEEPNK